VFLWFSADWKSERRKLIFTGIAGTFLALVITRVVQNLSPVRPRPIHSGQYRFDFPYDGPPAEWSSFPSDTAGLAVALAVTIWLANRWLGIAAVLWAIVVVSFPRLYGGYHYLSDLVAGGLIGVVAVIGLNKLRFTGRVYDKVAAWAARHEAFFYAGAYFVIHQIGALFFEIRLILYAVVKMLTGQEV
jgi:undecaprenyl-diphosphatase